MPLGTEVRLSLGDVVRRGLSSPPPKRRSPQFSAHIYCGHGRPSQLPHAELFVSSVKEVVHILLGGGNI